MPVISRMLMKVNRWELPSHYHSPHKPHHTKHPTHISRELSTSPFTLSGPRGESNLYDPQFNPKPSASRSDDPASSGDHFTNPHARGEATPSHTVIRAGDGREPTNCKAETTASPMVIREGEPTCIGSPIGASIIRH